MQLILIITNILIGFGSPLALLFAILQCYVSEESLHRLLPELKSFTSQDQSADTHRALEDP